MKRIYIVALFLLLGAGSVLAQQPAAATAAKAPATGAANKSAATSAAGAPAGQGAPNAAPAPVAAGLTKEELNKPFKGSFFLSPLEIEAIQQALAGRVLKDQTLGQEHTVPTHRVIRLSGVLYRAPTDWIAWINGHKVTRDNLLPEIVDISVKDSSKVSLKWYDVGLNKVIDITIRPDQTYDIPTGLLLPGSH